MRRPSRQLLIITFLLTAPVVAKDATEQAWTSPDGVVAVTPPSGEDFVSMDDPPVSFLSLWVSKDDSLYLGVVKSEASPGTTFDQSSAEKEIVEETKGEIVASSTVVNSGRTFWVVTVVTPGHGTRLHITQAMTQVGANVYKAYAGAVGAEALQRPAAEAFLHSFTVEGTELDAQAATASSTEAESLPVSPDQKHSNPAPAVEDGPDPQAHSVNLFEWIGGLGVLLIVGVLLWWLTGRGGGKA